MTVSAIPKPETLVRGIVDVVENNVNFWGALAASSNGKHSPVAAATGCAFIDNIGRGSTHWLRARRLTPLFDQEEAPPRFALATHSVLLATRSKGKVRRTHNLVSFHSDRLDLHKKDAEVSGTSLLAAAKHSLDNRMSHSYLVEGRYCSCRLLNRTQTPPHTPASSRSLPFLSRILDSHAPHHRAPWRPARPPRVTLKSSISKACKTTSRFASLPSFLRASGSPRRPRSRAEAPAGGRA